MQPWVEFQTQLIAGRCDSWKKRGPVVGAGASGRRLCRLCHDETKGGTQKECLDRGIEFTRQRSACDVPPDGTQMGGGAERWL